MRYEDRCGLLPGWIVMGMTMMIHGMRSTEYNVGVVCGVDIILEMHGANPLRHFIDLITRRDVIANLMSFNVKPFSKPC